MRIKVISCESRAYWYGSFIGQVLDVEPCGRNSYSLVHTEHNIKQLKKLGYNMGRGYGISKKDTEVVDVSNQSALYLLRRN